MAKKKKVPKKILGFKLSKGTRKDLKKLLKMFGNADSHKVAASVAAALTAYLIERFGEHQVEKLGKRGHAAAAH